MEPNAVLDALRRHLLVDGFDLVLDLERSAGTTLVDARDGSTYLDMFTFFASNALGMNHPRLTDPDVRDHLGRVALNKPSNSDVYTAELGRFVEAFSRVLGVDELPHLFLIDGGALAVENVLKAAFDWKSRWNEAHGRDPALGSKVLHLTGAFHGRSGYTMSLTNTDPRKVARFPKFAWPRLDTPALRFPLDQHVGDNRSREDAVLAAARDILTTDGHDIACFLAEPILGEGGDRHLSGRFLQEMRGLCHEHDVLFALDEIQTGVGLTGTAWAFQQLGVTPDLVAFGKKTHVCGVMAGGRMDEVEDHVFRTSSRVNSTFGGNLVDIARMAYVLDVIEDEALFDNAAKQGDLLRRRLEELEERSELVSQARGRGLMCAIDLPDAATRDRVVQRLFDEEQVILLGCGERTLRFRPALTVTEDDIDRAVTALERVVTA